jgi:hypothetical protein
VSGILGAIASAVSWTFPAANSAVTLLLGGLVGWGIRELLSLPGRKARQIAQERLIKKVVTEALEEDWRKRHPSEVLTTRESVHLASSSSAAFLHVTSQPLAGVFPTRYGKKRQAISAGLTDIAGVKDVIKATIVVKEVSELRQDTNGYHFITRVTPGTVEVYVEGEVAEARKNCGVVSPWDVVCDHHPGDEFGLITGTMSTDEEQRKAQVECVHSYLLAHGWKLVPNSREEWGV